MADELLLTGELLLGDRDITVQQQWQQHTTPHLKQTFGASSATWQERKRYLLSTMHCTTGSVVM